MANYFVSTTGNDSTGDGSISNPWASPGKLIISMSDGDIGFVQSGQYSMSTNTTGSGGYMRFPPNIKIQVYGYENTTGDGCPTMNYPELFASTQNPSVMVVMSGDFNSQQILSYFKINGNFRVTDGIRGTNGSNLYNALYKVQVVNCGGTYGIYGVGAYQCLSSGNYYGYNGTSAIGSVAINNSGDGFGVNLNTAHISQCIAAFNSGNGFDCGSYSVGVNCVSSNNKLDGFELTFNSYVINCISINNGNYGYDSDNSSILISCADYNNALSRLRNTPIDIKSIQLLTSPFQNVSGLDFRLHSNNGIPCMNSGLSVYGQISKNDIGAIMYSGAGSTTNVYDALLGNLII